MYLDEKLDTELRLGTATLGTNTITKLDGPIPLRISHPLPSPTSKDETDLLKLTLAPSSGSTSKSSSPKKTGSSTRKKTQFKHTLQQKQSLRITSDGKLWLGDQIVQLANPVSHLQGNHLSIIPYHNLMSETFPSSFATHRLQGSDPRNLHLPETQTQSRPRFSGTNSVQGLPTPSSSAQKLEDLLQDRHHPILHLPSYGSRGLIPNAENSNTAMRVNMYRLARLGRQELWHFKAFREEIIKWFDSLNVKLTQRIKEKDSIGITSENINKALDRAQSKLTYILLGFLITNYKNFRGKSDEKLLSEGWEYLKSYMVQWEDVNLERLANLKHIQANTGVWKWTSAETLGYLMWMDPKNTFSSKLFSRFISGWKALNGL